MNHRVMQVLHIRASWVVCIALAVYGTFGLFARMEADDFCEARDVGRYGIIGSTVRGYEDWSGRYSRYISLGILYSVFGHKAPAVAPALLVISLVATLKWALRPVSNQSWLVAAVFIYGLLASLPSMDQVLFWLSGSVTYLLPLICGAGLIGLLLRARSSHVEIQRGAQNDFRPVQPPVLTALALLALVLTVGWGAGRFADFQRYAEAWDAGENPPQLAQWAYLDSPSLQLAGGCRSTFSSVEES